MNGLRFIRIQCNLSLNNVAMALGVSRQIVSAWENGKKDIPKDRVEQLSRYFGIDTKYFGDIDEQQKREILGAAMYRWNRNDEEFFLYRPDKESAARFMDRCTFNMSERTTLLSDELKEKKRAQKNIVDKIDEQIAGLPWYTLQDQITSINRGVAYYDYCATIYKLVYEQPITHKMSYYYRALEVVKALSIVFGAEMRTIVEPNDADEFYEPNDYTYRVDPTFVQECAELISKHMNPMVKKLDEMDERMRKRKAEKRSLE